MSRTILVMAGGTGGHIFPALAVADVLRDRGWQVVWLGARGGMEERWCPPAGYAAEWIRFGGVRGKGWLRKLLLPFNLLRRFLAERSGDIPASSRRGAGHGRLCLFPRRHDGCAPRTAAGDARTECRPGLANRVLAGVADRVLSAFPDARGTVDVIWSGNPVRATSSSCPPEVRFANRSGPLRLLVVGGSLGAKALNETVPRALAQMAVGERPRVVHQAGGRACRAVARKLRAPPGSRRVPAFIDDMAARYGEADLVICARRRNHGAELAAAGVASMLVPFPHAVDDHQTATRVSWRTAAPRC
jgi:UDP-N-acetylglucosamine--N-acetylmuramyl-(pentapeptide) pyrophosphoryl-undecaprenol N-acetylglucosamine transferase